MEREQLTAEINRIIAAPYAVSLKGLHDIVTQANFPLAALRSWAILKPCHVDPLASLVLESLDEWPYTIHIFCVFASIEAFRDAILRQQPTVLDELLGRSLTAVSKHDASQTELNRPTPNDYATACVALLSTPLPESFLAPARLPAFISSLIQHMVEQPCAETISPLHQVMTGISGNQLEILPEETLSKFQSECTQVLRNMNDHVGNLLCLAIFAKISTTARKKTEAGPPVQGKWMQSICQFFDATRGVKTLDLAVLRAILACSASSNFSLQERIQCIELATEVCSAVDPAQRQEWILKNKVKIVKLCGKILRPDIDVQVQMRGLSFVTTLLPSEILPGEIIQSVFTILTSEHGRRCLCDISSDLLSSMIIATAKRFNQTQMSTCLKIVMSLFDVREESKMTTLSIGMMATVTTSVLPGLLKAARDSQPAKSTTFASLSGDRDISWFTRGGLISLQQRHDNCTQSPFCPCGSSRLYNELQLSFATLVLEALSPSLDTGASTQQAEICKFLSTLIRSMSDVAARPAVSLGSSAKSLHTLPTLHLPNASQDWRSKLAQNLTGHAEQFHGLVIQQMGQICRDLETRCNTVEEPLRSAREELGKLGAQYETCKQQRDKLMCKEAEVQTAMSALEAENQRLRQRAENAENRAHSLSSRLQTTQNELENSIRSGREALDHAEQRARDAELKYMATLTAKEDAIEERQEEIDGLKVELEQLAAQVEESTIREAETRCHAESLQVEVTSLRENLRVGNEKIAEGEEEIRKLNAQNDSLDAGIRDLQKQFDQNVTEMANIQADLQHNEETFQQEIASMKQQQQEVSSKAGLEIEERKSEIQKLQASIRTTKSKVIQALQTRDKKIETLKNELDALKRERTARAREFAKAQEYSNRLMAVFKAEGSTFSEAGTPKNRRPSAAQPLISPLSQRRFSTDFFDETDTHLLVTDSFDSCPSSNAEPTPKRPRSSRAQQPQQTPPSKQRTSSAAVLDIVDTAKRTRGSHVPASSHRRRPLSATSGNSPTKPDRKSFRLSDSQETVFEGTTSTVQDEADMTTIMMMSTMDPGSEFSRLDFSDENLFTGTGTRTRPSPLLSLNRLQNSHHLLSRPLPSLNDGKEYDDEESPLVFRTYDQVIPHRYGVQVKLGDTLVRKKVHNRTSRGRNDHRNERMREERLLRQQQQRQQAAAAVALATTNNRRGEMTIGGGVSGRGGYHSTRGQSRGGLGHGGSGGHLGPTHSSIIAVSSTRSLAMPAHLPQNSSRLPPPVRPLHPPHGTMMPQAPGLGGSTIRPSLPSHGSATLGQINMRFSPPSATPGLNLGSSSHITPAWTTWDSLSVVVVGLPPSVNTYTIWSNFQKHGSIEVIELYENAKGVREGKCKVRFKPPPWSEFWTHGRFDLELPDGSDVLVAVQVDVRKPLNFITSPVNPKVTYPRSINMKLTSMDFGTMVEEKTFLPLRTINAETQGALNYAVDLKRREVNVYFNVLKPAKPRPDQKPGGIQHALRLRIPFVEMTTVYQVKDGENVTFLIPLANPPVYHRKLNNLESTFSDTDNVWKEIDAWYRQIDIARVQEEMDRLSANLRKTNSLINIARWTTFRITFDKTDIDKKNNFRTMCSVFKDFNIDIKEVTDVTMLEESHDAPMIWQWIDPPSPHPSKPTSSLYDLAETEYVHLPFVIRYQLEVCLSHGFLNEYTMDKEFATKLIELGEKKAKDLLEYVATEKKVYFDPMKIFDLPFVKGATNARIPKYCCYMRTAQITPTTIYYNTPSVDISNRVIRHYIEYADRFLRVRFTDEKKQGRINSTHNKCNDEVFTRIKRAMSNGITIGDRHYDFLAFGNSQFREHGAYFFAGVSNLTSANIRAWMGHFNDIRVIAKNAARLGQCFSTTRAVTGCPVQLREITDIKHNDYTFSDGVGRISKFLAQMIMTEFKIKTPSGEPPSVYQFRLGGCKGILAVSANALRQEIHIRPSQYKFAAKHNGLEIIRHSHFSMSTLNRQLIAVLSTLGVTDKVFIDKLRTMLANLDLAMNNDKKAIHLLQKYVDPNQMTLVLSDMVLDGFQKSKEPFVTSLLELWRAWQIKYLKEKAKIVIEKGACVLGCLDETNTLKGHITQPKVPEDAPLEEKLKRLPEIFIQIPRSDDPASGKYEVIEGLCILARNPSLHPGDIRVVKAVNVPALHHLKDVVVLPQSGDRDVASMCSGGDLDGDDYVVFWDQDLLPRDWFRDPMDYSAPEPLTLSREVTVNDITTFFVQYIKNDRLPQIAHAHLAFADWFDNGVENEKCIRLAELHSAAVDYNKTGIAAMMTRDLIPRKWPHFMEKKHKPKEAQYVSEKILGKLYDIVKRVDFRPNLQEPFDDRILNSGVEVSDELMKTAMELKEQYDADMRRIMAQHDIKTEFEVWSTFVLSHANMSKDYKFHEELGGISTALREKFRLACYEKAGGRDFKSIAPLAVAMYKVTNQQVKAAWAAGLPPASIDDESSGEFRSENPAKLPLISFPWVLQQVLGKIANGHFDTAVFSGTVPSATSPHHQREKARKSKKDELDGLDAPHDIQTAEGIQHSGELLELFHDGDLLGDDPFSGLGEAFENTNISEKENQKDVVSAPGGVPPKLPALLIDFDFDFGSDTKVDRTPLSPTATSPNIPQTASPAYIPVVVDLLAFGDEYLPSDRNGGSLVSNIQSVATALPPSKPHRKPRLNGGNTPPSWPKVLHPGSTRSTTPSVPPSTIQNDDVETRVEVEGEVKPSAVDDLEMLLAL